MKVIAKSSKQTLLFVRHSTCYDAWLFRGKHLLSPIFTSVDEMLPCDIKHTNLACTEHKWDQKLQKQSNASKTGSQRLGKAITNFLSKNSNDLW